MSVVGMRVFEGDVAQLIQHAAHLHRFVARIDADGIEEKREVVSGGLADRLRDLDIQLVIGAAIGQFRRMNLVGRESFALGVLEIRYKLTHGFEVLRTRIGPDAISVGAEKLVHGKVNGLAQNVPQAVIDGRCVRQLPHPAFAGRPLRSERWKLQHTLARQQALGILKPSQIAPVRVPIALGQRVVAFDPALGHDGSNAGQTLSAGPFRSHRAQDIDFDLFDRKVGQVSALDPRCLCSSAARISQSERPGARQGAPRGGG